MKAISGPEMQAMRAKRRELEDTQEYLDDFLAKTIKFLASHDGRFSCHDVVCTAETSTMKWTVMKGMRALEIQATRVVDGTAASIVYDSTKGLGHRELKDVELVDGNLHALFNALEKEIPVLDGYLDPFRPKVAQE